MLEGLEIKELKLSEVQRDNDTVRLDSQFFLKEYFGLLSFLSSKPHMKLGAITSWITQGPNPNFCEPSDCSIPCLTGRNINKGRANYDNSDFVDPTEYASLHKFQLRKGDTLVTLKGLGSIGKIGYVTDSRKAIFSRDIGIIRPSDINHAYLNAYLLSKFGQKLIARGETGGTGQRTLTTSYLRGILIPRLAIEDIIGNLVVHSEMIFGQSLKEYKNAENILLKALGLDTYAPTPQNTNIKSFRESFCASSRLDAEFFMPSVRDMLARLGYDRLAIKDVAQVRKERFTPAASGDFNYIEIGGLNADGTAQAERLLQGEAPTRATQYVHTGDVITSTVRPIRRLSASIDTSQDGCVCSSGFVVLQPYAIRSDVLLTYLRLPPVCALLDLHTSASMYPAISEADLLALPIPNIPTTTQQAIEESVCAARQAKQRSIQLLEVAKRTVEIAIEEDEAAAMAYIEANTQAVFSQTADAEDSLKQVVMGDAGTGLEEMGGTPMSAK